MKPDNILSTLLGGLAFLSAGLASPVSNYSCKCAPSDPCWPSPHSWASLNTTVSGALISTIPLASVCYPDQPNFSPEACEAIYNQWTSSDLHSSDPASVMWPLWAGLPPYLKGPCLPTNGTGAPGNCNIGGYAVYSINATRPEHVIAAIEFARKYNIRLVVKNTGHDFFGRGTGFGALSIWTHNLRGLDFSDNFVPKGGNEGEGKAFTISAGHQCIEVYEEAAKKGLVVVGGANPSVGCAGGYLQGGGHGPLSSEHGLAADNVLEFELVTTSGEHITANSYVNSDIFWALRGGGGGTYGVVLKATVRAYPSPQTTMHILELTTTIPGNLTALWDALTYIHSQFPTLSDQGFQGYYGMYGIPRYPTFIWGFFLYNKPNGTAEKIFAPIQKKLDSLSFGIAYNASTTAYSSWLEAYRLYTPESVALNGVLASRLVPRKSLEVNQSELREALIGFIPNSENGGVSGHLIAGGQVVRNRGLDMGLNPAWRDTYLHLVAAETWNDTATAEEVDAIRDQMAEHLHALDAIAPRPAAYFNEGDALDTDWKEANFGANYDRLSEVKKKYDPEGMLWCRWCVRSDEWEIREDGRLCLVA